MDNNSPANAAAETLLSFFDAMETWEVQARSLYKQIEAGRVDAETGASTVRTAIAGIFEKFCAESVSPSRFTAGRVHFGASTPAYGRKREEIVEISVKESAVQIQTIRRGPPVLKLLYTLTKVHGEWRIEDNRRRLRNDGTTTAWDL